MKIHDEKNIRRAFEKWIEENRAAADQDINHAVFLSPEMTPIEQMVFFKLKWAGVFTSMNVEPQKQIGNYRVDFLVTWEFNRAEQFIIECDGHDFHERTKEQAQRDKKRDRDLQALGFKVYRFTGSEIWQSDGACVLQALGILDG